MSIRDSRSSKSPWANLQRVSRADVVTMGLTYGLADAFGGAQPGNTSVRSPRGCIGTPCMRPCGVYDAGAMRPSWCESAATQARGPGTLQSSRSLWPKPRSQTPDVFVLGKSELVVGSG